MRVGGVGKGRGYQSQAGEQFDGAAKCVGGAEGPDARNKVLRNAA